MKICGACEKELPKESFSGKQWKVRRSMRRCKDCVAAGNELVLFTEGRERSVDDECPICSRLLPLKRGESTLYSCCMKTVCNGCSLEAYKRGMDDHCPFCRTHQLERGDDEARLEMIQNRVKANDPVAMHDLGLKYRDGSLGLGKDLPRAVELFERAAEYGSNAAAYELGCTFNERTGNEGIGKDMSRAVKHFELAAKQGHHGARHNLGVYELESGNLGLALKHWMISAKLGDEKSLANMKSMYMAGLASKADYAEALRGYHEAIIEMSSPERDEAKVRRMHLKSLGLWS
ncbi:hypothetical protein THAOC_32171 [Thalassiosira oceanica]|uniref:RING-type domain-containing protein n=1 Tax=Thalassiosira oceanica TaxID=159749 RepID=K0RQK2_THAOC|nr:hypothetical protein THAOC_32171 [Thalassiosira oceanica]|eukprot:EJK48992.1 hypothetical protein THAOC_32171 [Thalassiosira oceanica]